MINLVNALKAEYGVDETRVELARELKMSREERERMAEGNRRREKENKAIAEKIRECGLFPTKSRIRKYMLWEEAGEKCLYCGQILTLSQCLNGDDMEVEHIIPKSVLYDDSYGNKTCACRRCNKEKGNRTALEYIRAKGWEDEYMERINGLLDKKAISYSKHQRLRWLKEDIPSDFLERQLRLTQYISRQAMAILQQGIRRVSASEGGVTARLRSLWGYDDILHTLNLDRYDSMGETERVSREGETTEKLRITNWSKRKDHRHHAIDALVVASTRQGYIQRLNRVSSESEREAMSGEIEMQKATKTDKLSLLERWLTQRPHLSVRAVSAKVAEILISYRPGKRVVTRGRNIYLRHGKKCVQSGLLVPRGPLSKETVYGQITVNGEPQIVCKYDLHSLKAKDVDYVVDLALRKRLKELLAQHGGKEKEAFAGDVYMDEAGTQGPIRSVRCFTGLDRGKMKAVKYDEQGDAVGFVSTQNNHHLAIYRTPKGKLVESIVTFWDAVDRARYGIPLVITHPREVIEQVLLRGDVPESVLSLLPPSDWVFVDSLQQDEMVIIGLSDEELQRALETQDYRKLSEHLYRVQKMSSSYYVFRYHLETSVADDKNTMGRIPKFYRVQSLKAYEEKNIRKVRVDLLGRISLL